MFKPAQLEYVHMLRDDAEEEDGGSAKRMQVATTINNRGVCLTLTPEDEDESVADAVVEIYQGKLRVHSWNPEQQGNDPTTTELYDLEEQCPSPAESPTA
jgi:hypothetical protein